MRVLETSIDVAVTSALLLIALCLSLLWLQPAWATEKKGPQSSEQEFMRSQPRLEKYIKLRGGIFEIDSCPEESEEQAITLFFMPGFSEYAVALELHCYSRKDGEHWVDTYDLFQGKSSFSSKSKLLKIDLDMADSLAESSNPLIEALEKTSGQLIFQVELTDQLFGSVAFKGAFVDTENKDLKYSFVGREVPRRQIVSHGTLWSMHIR